MQEHAVKIKAYLEDCRLKKFTGGIKMAFEKGAPKTFWRATYPDFQNKPVEKDFNLDKELAAATAGTFSGSLLFLLEDGIIKNFDSIETLQGRDLLERLDNYCITQPREAPKSRPALVIRKKAQAT
jgi:hypothetical protein